MAIEKRGGCRFLALADVGSFRRIGTVQLKQHFRSRARSAFLKHMRQYSLKTR